ncbi:MAG: phosphoadenosine phosphosulfate reductase family protein [Bacteroidales bacterium]|nr:phosphoadenosine phosphosulfate reductase family protein [Bacteroidales bacterium]
MLSEQLQKKVDRAIRLLQSIKADEIELSYSGGKDSDVILELAKMSGIKFRAIYKNTTIDPPYTIKHVKEKGVEIIRPKETFAQLIQKNGFPNQFMRFCCKYLKEYKVLDKAIHGIRRSESRKLSERYKEPTYCRVYNKDDKVEVFMPILEWSDDDIKQFVDHFKVKCHPLYYDNGVFHPERRLGCMCCPLASSRKRIEYFKAYPLMVRFYIRNGKRFLDTHTSTKTAKRFDSVYDWFVYDLFHGINKNIMEQFKPNMFGERLDSKKYLEDYFKIKL